MDAPMAKVLEFISLASDIYQKFHKVLIFLIFPLRVWLAGFGLPKVYLFPLQQTCLSPLISPQVDVLSIKTLNHRKICVEIIMADR